MDSEDLPLSLSREKPQDSRLLARINDVLTRKLLRFLDDELRKNRKSYQNFYAEFSVRRSETTTLVVVAKAVMLPVIQMAIRCT